MQSKRIFWTLLIAAMLVISTTATQAQSTGRKLWPRGDAGNQPAPSAPEQTTEHWLRNGETAAQELQSAAQGGILDVLERQKTAIVGSWLGTSSEGNKILITYNSDGTAFASLQGGVSTNPDFGVLTTAHGVWKHFGGRQFSATFISVNYDIETGAYTGMLKARLLLMLNENGDQISGMDKVEIFGADGNLVFAVPPGNTTFTRIKFEPFN